MIKNIIKTLSIVLLISLAGIWLGVVWQSLTTQQAIDYSLKSAITICVLIAISYIISLISPNNNHSSK